MYFNKMCNTIHVQVLCVFILRKRHKFYYTFISRAKILYRAKILKCLYYYLPILHDNSRNIYIKCNKNGFYLNRMNSIFYFKYKFRLLSIKSFVRLR